MPFGPRFLPTLRVIFLRLFRVYAHIYNAHYRQLEAHNHDDVVDLNTSYIFFIVFALQYARWPSPTHTHTHTRARALRTLAPL